MFILCNHQHWGEAVLVNTQHIVAVTPAVTPDRVRLLLDEVGQEALDIRFVDRPYEAMGKLAEVLNGEGEK